MTETKEITIASRTFAVLQPYAEGHVVTAAEAKALNQVRAENIRNNTASKVKAAIEGTQKEGEPTAANIDSYVADYDASYVFTLASVGGGKRAVDPVEVEALRIARVVLTEALRAKGIAYAKVPEDKRNEKLAEIASRDAIVKEAKKRVASRQKAAEEALGEVDLSDMQEAPKEAAAAE